MSGKDNMKGDELKGTTEVMKPVNSSSSTDAKTYSCKNTQKKATRKEKKATKERLTKVNEAQPVNSPSGRKSPTPVMTSKNGDAKKSQPEPQVDAEVIAEAALKVKDPNRKFFIIGTALIAFGFILFVLIAAFGFPYFYNQGATTANQLNAARSSTYKDSTDTTASQTEKKEETTKTAEEVCQHEWEEVRQTIHHDAVTHDVTHEPEYRTVTRYHTVCNVCDEQIDNQIAEHKEKTGHYSWSTNVPFEERELVAEGYTQTVTDQEAWDEQIVMGRKCKKCGQSELYD